MSIASVCEHSRLAALIAIALALALLALPAQAAEESTASLQKRCDAKQADACAELGFRHEHGEGVAADAARAAGLYAKACDLENGDACVALALMYEKGEGVPKDDSRFDSLFERGCKLGSGTCQDFAYVRHVMIYESDCQKGDAEACYFIGTAYYDGPEYLIVEKDRAAEYFRKACDGNDAQACFMIGLQHSDGDGVDKDAAKANELFRKSADLSRKGCDGNSKEAAWDCRRLGALYNHGLGVAADPARARTLFDKSCRLGDKEACSIQVANAAAPRPKPSVAVAPAPANAPAAPQGTVRAAAPASAPAKAAGSDFMVLKMRLGVDTVASVERDIKARGGAPNVGGGGHGKYTLNSLSGDYSDGGPAIMAVNYDFDAAAPTGKLVAVTVVRKVEYGPPFTKLLAERKAFLTSAFGTLQAKSATESTGSRPGCTLALHENPDTGFLYEVYKFAQ